MPDTKITDLATGTTLHSADWLVYVDTTDTSMAATGTDKKLSPAVLSAALAITESQVTNLVSDLAAKATDTLVVHLAGTETITGAKTFSSVPTWPTQTANRIFAGPGTGVAAAPTFRALVAADLPIALPVIVANGGTGLATLTAHAVLLGEGTGNVAFAAVGTAGRVLIDQGAAADPTFTAVSGDGTLSSAGALTVTKTSGVAFAASATTDTTNAANISSGLLPAARLPAPSATTLGGIQSAAAVAHQWIASISTLGVPSLSQPAFSDISGTIVTAQIGAAQVTYSAIQNEAASSILGNPTGSAAAPSEVTLGPNLAFSGTTLRGRVPLAWITGAGTAVANSIALTSLFAGATVGGSLTIPANMLLPGSMLVFSIFGTASWTTGSPTMLIQLSLGGVLIGQTAAFPLNASAQTGFPWLLNPLLGPGYMCRSTGVSGAIIGAQEIRFGYINTAIVNLAGSNTLANSAATINTTGSLAIDAKVQWGTASASNTIQLTGGAIYLDY